jgi:hypothetical protein
MFPITITINNAEQFEAVRKALGGEAAAPAKPATRAAKAVAAANAAPAEQPKTETAPAAASKASLQEVAAAISGLAKVDRAKAVAILAANGAAKASELKADKYDAVVAACNEALNPGPEASGTDGLL